MIRKKVMNNTSSSLLNHHLKSFIQNNHAVYSFETSKFHSLSELSPFKIFESKYYISSLNNTSPTETDLNILKTLPRAFSFSNSNAHTQSCIENKQIFLSHVRNRHFFSSSPSSSASSSSKTSNLNLRTNGRRTYLVDTLALVRKLEKHGLSAEQAEVITETITQILSESMDNISHAFVSKPDMQMMEMTAESTLSKLKADILNAHEHNVDSIQREVERIKTDIEKLRSELRYEIDKVTAGQRLDLNLERGRIREELSNQNQQTINLTSKLDREINNLRTDLEAAKFDVIKYCVGTLVSVSAVALGLLRILM